MKNTIKTTLRNIFLFIFLLSLSNYINAQRLIDTNEKFEYYIENGKGQNDCTVRAYAIIKNINYNKSYEIMKNLGRKDNEGFDIRLLLQHLQNENIFIGMTDNIEENNISARLLINKGVLNKNNNYLVFTKGHVFAIVHDGKRFVTYGNYNDLDLTIISLISVNKYKINQDSI